jgi:hypothetical protein
MITSNCLRGTGSKGPIVIANLPGDGSWTEVRHLIDVDAAINNVRDIRNSTDNRLEIRIDSIFDLDFRDMI